MTRLGFSTAPGWIEEASGLARHRDLLWQMVATDLRGRYVGSLLGIFWSLVHPLVLVLIYTLVFSRLFGARLGGGSGAYDYGVYLCAGILPWAAFQDVVQRSATVFHDQSSLVRAISFPRVLLHGALVGSAAINLILTVGTLSLVLLLLGRPLSSSLVLWPAFLLLHLGFAVGLGIAASVSNVFFRDTAQIVSVILQFWFWLTPIVYTPDLLAESSPLLLAWNPLFHFTHTHQELLLTGRLPAAAEVVLLAGVSLTMLVAGLTLLARFRRRIPDEI